MSGENPGGLVTSDAVTAGARLRRRLLLAAGGVLVLVIIGAGVWLVLTKTPVLKAPKQQTATQLSPAQVVAVAQAAVQAAHSTSEKRAAYSALGDAYTGNGQAVQGATAYQQALTYSPDDIYLMERLSSAYVNAGDKANAIKTLQKLIPLMQASDIPDKNFLLSRYQGELDYLQGKGS